MWKNMLGVAAILFGAGYFLQSFPTAHAKWGPTISMASNPLFSTSGYATNSPNLTLSAASGQEMVLTDVVISAQFNYELELIFTTSGNQEIGRFKAWNYNGYSNGVINSHFLSGLRVPDGESLSVTLNGRGSYTISGYYAQP